MANRYKWMRICKTWIFNFGTDEESADNMLLRLIQRCDEKHEDFKYFDPPSEGSWVEFPYKRRWSLYCRRSSICRHIRELHSRYVCTVQRSGPSAVIIVAIMHIQISNQHHWGSGQGSRSLKRGFTRELLAKRAEKGSWISSSFCKSRM